MDKETRILRLQNRIALLEGRNGKDNGMIVKKLKRQLCNLTKEQ